MLDELIDVAVFHVLNDLRMASLLVPAAVIMAVGYRRIAEPETRRMVNRMMWLTIANHPAQPRPARGDGRCWASRWSCGGCRVVQVAYYFGNPHGRARVRREAPVPAVGHARPAATQEFVERFGISNRERDIVSMIVQGHANRIIGERLFISDRTVKNHISNIYRKTGAVNKVQLLNMVRNHPDPRGDDRRAARRSEAVRRPQSTRIVTSGLLHVRLF